ncbi:MAG: hypothetical protein KJ556_16160 [Gammaproteobacteria bacterium]|nr:hypothetical protein [Gammaproteobacteria bacterium]MBU2058296.1 hypothetical protein [Gammaproteobacteria bacterium]MBU2176651.1 hypothetical protein [Gammaproteobacteria bacterium]MBU2248407.1 hypothetical protein [Gammaproteobacteria bacterium]MBU2345730.1 hypothetical protein [Gammaproteobacteria bacterium]
MRHLVILSSLLLIHPTAHAGYLDLLDPNNWNMDYFSNLMLKQIYKKAKKPEDVNVIYEMNYNAFQSEYRNHLVADEQACKRASNNPAWIDGAKIPAFNDSKGIKVFTVAENSNYILAQRDLSKRGSERLRSHWFNWVISEGSFGKATIIQNTKKDDAYTPYKFSKPILGNDILVLNTVLSEEWNISIGISGSLDSQSLPIDTKQSFKVGTGKGLVLSHCDVYKVKVVGNTAPTVSQVRILKATYGDHLEHVYYHAGFWGEDKETSTEYLTASWKAVTKNGNTLYSANPTAKWDTDLADEIVTVEVIISDGDKAAKHTVTNVENIYTSDYSHTKIW